MIIDVYCACNQRWALAVHTGSRKPVENSWEVEFDFYNFFINKLL